MTTCPVCRQRVRLAPAGLILEHSHQGERCPASALYPHEAHRSAHAAHRGPRVYAHPDPCNKCLRGPCECDE